MACVPSHHGPVKSLQLVIAGAFGVAGIGFLLAAVVEERRMQRHRQPGVSYASATLRRDGGWRRAELFTSEGLRHQRRASACGIVGALLLMAALLAWIVLGRR